MSANYATAADLFAKWKAELLSGKPPILFPISEDERFASIEIGPRNVMLIGGPPGAGKSAFVMQLVIDALRLTPELKALVCNVEMPPTALLDRQLARLSGIPLSDIRHRRLTADHAERLTFGLEALAAVAERLAFVGRPHSFENIAHAADAFAGKLIVLDYLQRIAPPGEHGNRKASVDASMDLVRQFADEGAAVVVVAAVGRHKNSKGQNAYEGLNLASFRESSELEYGADDAYLLVRESKDDPEAVTLLHVKSRNGELRDIPLRFIGANQRFDALDDDQQADDPLTRAARAAWGDAEQEAGESEGGSE